MNPTALQQEIEMAAGLLASVLSPQQVADYLRQLAEEIVAMQPTVN